MVVPKPALERLGVETPEPIRQRFTLELQSLRPLKTFPQHTLPSSFRSGRQLRPPDLH
jgi:hypothetical protein